MREDSPRWEQINPSAFPHEQDGLRELASYLPDAEPYHVWANVEFVGTDGSINEVDALILTRSGLYVLELKHWQGEIEGDGMLWMRRMPNGRRRQVDNPYILANRKAKRLASLIRFYARQPGKTPYVGAAVFLHARNMRASLDPIGRQHVYGLDGHNAGLDSLKKLLLTQPSNPSHVVDAVRARQIVELVKGAKIRPSVAERNINQLQLHQRPFAEGIGWQDFLADHSLDAATTRRVRFYLTSRAAEEDIPSIKRAAEREFRLLQGIHHPGIARATDLVEHPWGPAVVFDHQPSWVRFDQWLVERGPKLHMAQRLQLVQDLAEIIDYAHSRRLVHRSLHPRAIFVSDPDGPRPTLVVTDWQTGARLASTRLTQLTPPSDPASLEIFFDDQVRRYQAPEATTLEHLPGHQLDLFALGALTYRIFAGADPAASADELLTAVADGGLHLDAVVDGMPYALVQLVYDATRGDPAERTARMADFRSCLELVWDELTAPEPEPVIDPLQARRGDVLDGGLVVKDRLGSGATATALLVDAETPEGRRDLVLKVARDEQHRERFAAEARTLDKVRDSRVAALVKGPVQVGPRTALLMENAGSRTLAEDLREGRLSLDLLERYGRDLLEIVAMLDGQGVWHRDIKPANLAARPRPKDKQPHLCIFDFSLADTPADQINAGTTGYLDPFLGPPRRMRYDAAAERFSAAVTLYEMATGTLPRWGDNANPAAISEEVTLDPAAFDQSVADRLVAFFDKALARDTARRFDTLDEMTDAWRAIFRDIPELKSKPGEVGPATVLLDQDSPLEATTLTARARSALERLGVHTVGELLDAEPSALTRARGVPDATRKEILAKTRALREEFAEADATAASPAPVAGQPTAQGIEAISATLLPPETSRNQRQRRTLQVLLGQATGNGDTFLHWPAQAEVARATDQVQPQISTLLRRFAGKEWLNNPALTTIRDEIVALLDGRGAVMSSEELADALVAARGSFTAEPKRTAQAIGLVRAAVEAELNRGGDARLAIQRFQRSEAVLIGREPDDPAAESTAADLLAYVVRLGRQAATLAAADPLPTRQRAVEELRTLAAPAGMPLLSDQRLLQLAAAGSNGQADVNPQGQLYPRAMPAERALKLAIGGLVGQFLDPETVRARVRARFPRAQELPDRPELDDLLRAGEAPLTWHPGARKYGPRDVGSSVSGTRWATTLSPLLGPDEVAAAHTRLTGTIDRHGFLVLLASLRRLGPARRALLARLRLTEVDVTAILLDQLRALGFPWEAIVAADSGSPADPDFRSLVELVQHHVVPAVEQAIDAAERPVLITEAAPLARYGQLQVIQHLADPTRPRAAARLLLVPARGTGTPVLDGVQVPLTSPGSQSMWLPEAWITPAPERTTPR
ncbi:BREX system serine/threonine kinase PglW [Plantactinospora sp. S1510]|uniref:BREX system serine/threonine kinase PglW n=1 Tax=Plantactinospora alkalitolerans TaxID=2789879 RepID=A0ABS0GNP7_9ACTN|nr:BREX system serine/threonine kinase PglW [Plantactinospora alkalitolerans]MBF9127694.1 BREX system serine/threonine kinase PglW [Plantactinospora alkalitolerans]